MSHTNHAVRISYSTVRSILVHHMHRRTILIRTASHLFQRSDVAQSHLTAPHSISTIASYHIIVHFTTSSIISLDRYDIVSSWNFLQMKSNICSSFMSVFVYYASKREYLGKLYNLCFASHCIFVLVYNHYIILTTQKSKIEQKFKRSN